MMILKMKHFVVFATICFSTSCTESSTWHIFDKKGSTHEMKTPATLEASQIRIGDTLEPAKEIEDFIAPYRKRVNEVLDSTLAFAPKTLTKDDGAYNSSAGNLLADIVRQEADSVFVSRTDRHIDFVLLNHGGIRSIISKGPISARSAYEVMPFENEVVVAKLSGFQVMELAVYLRDSGRAHPISGLQVVLDKDNEIASIKIQGRDLDKERNYNVATSDYLLNGGDNMVFFKDALAVEDLDYKVRNLLIDYFMKVDTVVAETDNRFIKLGK